MSEQMSESGDVERLSQIAALHHPIVSGPNEGFCDGCESAWPCPTRKIANARDARDRAVALSDTMRERLSRVHALRDRWQAEVEDDGDGLTYLSKVLDELRAAVSTPPEQPSSDDQHHGHTAADTESKDA